MLDTDVVVAAMRSPRGASAALPAAARRGRIVLVGSVALALEYVAQCTAAEHLLAAGLDRREAAVFVDAVLTMLDPVETRFLWRPQLRDPADEMVQEAAVNSRAAALATFNVRDFGTAPARFGVAALTPRDLLARIGGVRIGGAGDRGRGG